MGYEIIQCAGKSAYHSIQQSSKVLCAHSYGLCDALPIICTDTDDKTTQVKKHTKIYVLVLDLKIFVLGYNLFLGFCLIIKFIKTWIQQIFTFGHTLV